MDYLQKGAAMRYHIHFGSLYAHSDGQEESCLYYIKPPVYSQNKLISAYDGTDEFSVEMDENAPGVQTLVHRYLLKNRNGEVLLEGQPGCGFDSRISLQTAPQAFSQTFPRPSRADHVRISSPSSQTEISGILLMQNSQNFILTAPDGHKTMELIHNGASGGWNICADDTLSAVLVMGVFLFSRYLDKENEFVNM